LVASYDLWPGNEWDDSDRKGINGQKNRICKVNEKRKGEKAKEQKMK